MAEKTIEKETPAAPRRDEGFGETVRTIFFAIMVALVIRTFAFEPFNIPSSSMVPTLLVGDFLFVSKYSYGYSGRGTFMGLPLFSGRAFASDMPKRGDVVVFKLPKDNSTDYIKRLIGLPGDTVQVKEGLLYINGSVVPRARLAEPLPGTDEQPLRQDVTDYMESLPNGPQHIIREKGDNQPLDNTAVFIVPEHHYFMMGDNRDNSQDSRTTVVGFVPEENLVGRAEVVFFSLDEGVHFWEFWRWPWAVRWSRLLMKIG